MWSHTNCQQFSTGHRCLQVLGHLVDLALSQGAGHPLLARAVILSGKGTGDVGIGDGLAASPLEVCGRNPAEERAQSAQSQTLLHGAQ